MSQKTKIVLVGIGRMGKNHLRVFRETPGFEVVAVVESQGTLPDLGSIKLARSIAELKGIDFDAAVIATPTATHHAIALELIGMGKHLLVEKPVASTFAQAREVIAAAHAKGLKLVVGHVERFNPAVRKLREVIREGWLGAPIHFSFTRVGGYPETILVGNNVLLDLAVHDIDVLRSLVGPVRMEHSMCHVTFREGIFDTAEIMLAAKSGSSATIHTNWITPTKIRSVRVTGTRAVCFVDYILQTVELHGGSLLKNLEPSNYSFDALQDIYRSTDKITFGVQKVEPLRAQAGQWKAFLDGGDIGELCTGNDALAAVLLAERAMKTEPRPKLAVGKSVPPPATSEVINADDEWV